MPKVIKPYSVPLTNALVNRLITTNNVLSFGNNFYPSGNYSAEHNLIPKAYHWEFLRLVNVNIKFTNAICNLKSVQIGLADFKYFLQ